MKMNMSKFKKVAGDKDHSIMKHEDGHMMRIEHKPLSHKMRKEILAIPMYDGGDVEDQDNKKPKPKPSPTPDPSGEPSAAKKFVDSFKKATNYDEGGQVVTEHSLVGPDRHYSKNPKSGEAGGKSAKDMESGATQGQTHEEDYGGGFDNLKKELGFAQGGDVEAASPPQPQPSPQPVSDTRKEFAKKFKQGAGFAQGGKVPRYAEGTGDVAPVAEQEAPKKDSPEAIAFDASLQVPLAAPESPQAPANVPPALTQPAKDYGQLYQQHLDFLNQFTPGEPDKEGAARRYALELKKSDENAAKVQAEYKQQDAKQAAEKQAVQAAQEKELGIGSAPAMSTPAQVPGQTPPKQPESPAGTDSANPQSVDMFGSKAASDLYGRGILEKEMSFEAGKNAAGAQGNAEANAYQQGLAQQQKIANDYQTQYAQVDKQRGALQQAIADQHIDPNHYVNSMSTGDKISTMLGLVMGGLGSGLSGKDNMPMKYINDQITRDIDAQKAELGKKENLLTHVMSQYGNMRDGATMAHILTNDIVSSRINQIASTFADPRAQAAALNLAGQLHMDSADKAGLLSARRTIFSSDKVSPEQKIQFLDKSIQPQATKEFEDSQKLIQARDNVLDAIKSVAQLNTAANKLNPRAYSKIAAKWGPMLANLSKETAGRLTPQDVELLDSLKPSVIDGPEEVAVKLDSANRTIMQKIAAPTLVGWGIDPAQKSKYNANGKLKLELGPPVR